VTLASEAGLRKGEILGLREDAVDLERRVLDVVGQAQTLKGGVRLDQSTKSESSYRRIPLAAPTVEALARHLEQHGHRSGLVVTTKTGQPVRSNLAHEHWQKACREAGVEGLRLHDLRHRFASGLIAHGIDPKRLQTLLGHASITETMDTYGHLWPNGDDKVRAAIEAMRD
jgi:integrase